MTMHGCRTITRQHPSQQQVIFLDYLNELRHQSILEAVDPASKKLYFNKRISLRKLSPPLLNNLTHSCHR
jgi:hypothetical protein